jgi:hypothetical protein
MTDVPTREEPAPGHGTGSIHPNRSIVAARSTSDDTEPRQRERSLKVVPTDAQLPPDYPIRHSAPNLLDPEMAELANQFYAAGVIVLMSADTEPESEADA